MIFEFTVDYASMTSLVKFLKFHIECRVLPTLVRSGWPQPPLSFFLPPLKLKIAYFYHNIITFSLQLSHHSDHSGQNPVNGEE